MATLFLGNEVMPPWLIWIAALFGFLASPRSPKSVQISENGNPFSISHLFGLRSINVLPSIQVAIQEKSIIILIIKNTFVVEKNLKKI